MGQYYQTVYKEQNKNTQYYNRYLIIDGKEEYTMAKLTEHSWFYNDYVNTICNKIYNTKNKVRIIWMGDYSNEFLDEHPKTFNKYKTKALLKLYEVCWNNKKDRTKSIQFIEFNLLNKYLVNHTKKLFIDCSKYLKNNVIDGWCLHPLPLLTCIGNGCGGGDYRGPSDDSDFELVGTWAWDKISILDSPPNDYLELSPIFKEKWMVEELTKSQEEKG